MAAPSAKSFRFSHVLATRPESWPVGIQTANPPSHMGADQQDGDSRNLRNRYVHFRINDVHVPEPAQILEELHGQDLLFGRIIDLSDQGTQPGAFAVVEVGGLSQSVVVPVAKILAGTE